MNDASTSVWCERNDVIEIPRDPMKWGGIIAAQEMWPDSFQDKQSTRFIAAQKLMGVFLHFWRERLAGSLCEATQALFNAMHEN